MRRPVQIATLEGPPRIIVALCDDGTIWQYGDDARWLQTAPIPQPPDPLLNVRPPLFPEQRP